MVIKINLCQVIVKLVAHELNIPVNRCFIGSLLHKSHGKMMIKGAQARMLDWAIMRRILSVCNNYYQLSNESAKRR